MPNSGKFVLRAGKELHRKIKEFCLEKGMSINEFCVQTLMRSFGDFAGQDSTIAQPYSSHPFLPIIEKLNVIFKEEFQGLVLFGSTVQNSEFDNSDIDLLIIVGSQTKINRSLYTIWDNEVCANLGNLNFLEKVTPHFSQLPDSAELASSLWFEISVSGILLWEKSSRVTKFLTKLRLYISSGAVIRKLIHAQPYWVKIFI